MVYGIYENSFTMSVMAIPITQILSYLHTNFLQSISSIVAKTKHQHQSDRVKLFKFLPIPKKRLNINFTNVIASILYVLWSIPTKSQISEVWTFRCQRSLK